MVRSADVAQKARKRAMKVSIRTFQRVPNVVSETEAGEPIVEMAGARLVLPHGVGHFRQLARCSRCQRESMGEPVVTAAQLGPPRLIFCDDCTRSSVDFDVLTAPAVVEARAEEASPSDPAPEPAPAPSDSCGEVPQVPPAGDGTAAVWAGFARQQEELGRFLAANHEQAAAIIAERVERAMADQEERLNRRLDEGLAQLEPPGNLAERVERAIAAHEEALNRPLNEALHPSEEPGGPITKAPSDQTTTLRDTLREQHEAHREAVDTLLGERYQRLAQQVGVGVGERLEQHRQSLGEDLRANLDHQVQAVEALLAGQLDQRHARLTSQLAVALGDRLEQHRQALEAAMIGQLDRSAQGLLSELQAAASLPEEHDSALVELLTRRLPESLDAHRTALEAGVAAQVEDRLSRLIAETDERAQAITRRIEEAIADQRDRERECRTRDLLTVAAELETRLDRSETETARRLDRVAAGGTMQIALLQAIGERVVSSMAAVKSGLTQFRSDLSATEQAVAQLRSEVREVRSLAMAHPLGPAVQASLALYAGLGVAGPPEVAGSSPPVPPDLDDTTSPPAPPARARAARKVTTGKAAGAGRASAGKASTGKKAGTARTSATGKTSAGKTSAGKTSAGKTSAGKTSAGKTSSTTRAKAPATRKSTTAKAGAGSTTRKRALPPATPEPPKRAAAARKRTSAAAGASARTTATPSAAGDSRSVIKTRLASARRALDSAES